MPGTFARYSLLILLAAALAYLLGNASAPLLDRDEPRYALTSRNMLVSGDYVVPRQYDRPRTAKPPLIYWLQATSMRLIGQTSAFAARLPSSVAMLLVVAMLLLFLRKESDDLTALIGTAIFAFSGLTLFLAKIAITDAVLLASTAVSMGCWYHLWRGGRGWGLFILLGIATGVGGLTKGPVILAIQGMTLAALLGLRLLDRRHPARADWRTFPYPATPAKTSRVMTLAKAAVALAITLAIVLPWMIKVQQQTGGMFLTTAVQNDIIQRSVTIKGVDGQARPPGFYLLTVFGTFFPFSLLLPAALVIAFRERHRPLTRFCLAMAIGPWLMFESVTSKMVHWFLPVFLPLAILTGDAAVRCWRGKYTDLTDKRFAIAAWIWGTGVALLGLASWAAVPLAGFPWWGAAAVSTLVAATGLLAAWHMSRARLPTAIAIMAAGMAVLFPLLFGLVVPHWQPVTLGQATGLALHRLGATGRDDVAMTDFREPSIAFYQGGTIREREYGELPSLAASWVVMSRRRFDEFPPEVRQQWDVAWSRKGVAYARGTAEIDALILRRRTER